MEFGVPFIDFADFTSNFWGRFLSYNCVISGRTCKKLIARDFGSRARLIFGGILLLHFTKLMT